MQFKVGTTVTNDAGNAIPADWSEKLTTPECMTWTESELLAQGALKREFKFIRTQRSVDDQRGDLGERHRQ